jgi:hypothetical protein
MSDMNCHELHAYFEDEPRLDAAVFPEMASHTALCADCAQFVEEQAALKKSLRLIRESVIPVPESLDARALESFRGQMSAPKPVISLPRRTLSPVLRWTAAIAAALLVAAILFATSRKPTVATLPPAPQTEAVTSATVLPQPAPVRGHAAATPKRLRRAGDHPAVASNQLSDRIPDRFRSLMYCDELACAGPMDVIRLQLPSDFVARPARGLIQTGGPVTADVLVGPDGIARGIRIVE